MKLEQLSYSILSFNFHYQNIRKELSLLNEFMRKNQAKIKSAIDVGCGDGFVTEKIRDILGLDTIYGLDLNKVLLRQAAKRGVKTILSDMESVDLMEKFDLVVCYGSLHHAKKIDNFVTSLKKMSSKYILIVDNTVRKNIYHKITGSKYFPLESSPYCIHGAEEIRNALELNGCHIIDVRTNKNANIWHDRSFILASV